MELLDNILAHYMAAKIQALHIKNQNGANLVFNHGRDLEKKLGLPPQITPFPSPTSVSIGGESSETTQNTWSDWLRRYAGPTLLGASLLGGGGGLGWWLASDPAEPPPSTPAVAPADSTNGNVAFTVE